jgi:hypothetical protein
MGAAGLSDCAQVFHVQGEIPEGQPWAESSLRAARHELPSGCLTEKRRSGCKGARNRTEGKKAQRAEAALPVESKNQPGGMAKRGVEGCHDGLPFAQDASRQKGVYREGRCPGGAWPAYSGHGPGAGRNRGWRCRGVLRSRSGGGQDPRLYLDSPQTTRPIKILIQLEDKWNDYEHSLAIAGNPNYG